MIPQLVARVALAGALVGALCCSLPVVAAPVAAPVPLENSDGGWTFQIPSSGFMPPDRVRNPDLPTSQAPAFVALFEAKSAAHPEPVKWNLNLRARVFSPQDVPLSTQLSGRSVICPSVNPAWPFVWVEFYGRDPFAADGLSPQTANGEINQDFVLDLPKPEEGKELVIDKEFTSDIGSTFKVEKLKFSRENERNLIKVSVSWKAPADAPEAILRANQVRVLDTNGKPIPGGSGGGVGRDNGEFTVYFDELPTGDTWHLRFGLQQNLASRAVANGRFKVRIKVPLDAKNVVVPTDAGAQKPAKFAGEGFAGRIENAGMFSGPQWMGRLWIEGTNDTNVFWKPKSIGFFLPDGTAFKGNASGQPSQPFFHRDGTPAQKGEWAQQLMAMMPKAEVRPTTLSADIELEARRTVDSDFIVKAAIPKPGETLQLNEDAQTQNGASLTLVAARFYRTVAEVPGVRFPEQIPARGVALVFRGTPVSQNPATYYVLSDGQRGFARDGEGRPLDGALGVRWQDSNALEVHTAAQGFFTAFVPAPAPDATEIEIAAFLHEESEPIKTATVRVENVPVVPAPVQK